jgi:hypothetical protein
MLGAIGEGAMYGTLICLFLCGASMTYGQPSQPNEKAATQKSAPKKLGTEESPLVVTVHPNEADKKESERREAERKQKESSDDNLVYWTRVMAGLAFLQFGALLLHAMMFRSQARAMHSTVMEMQRGERGYVFSEVVLDTFNNTVMGGSEQFGEVKVRVSFWNYGKTPAVITMIRGYIELRDTVPHELLDFEGAEKELPPTLGVATNCAYPIELDHQFGIDAFSDIKNWNKVLYVLGKMEYSTIHDKPCVTSFCWHIVYRDVGSFITMTRESRLNART